MYKNAAAAPVKGCLGSVITNNTLSDNIVIISCTNIDTAALILNSNVTVKSTVCHIKESAPAINKQTTAAGIWMVAIIGMAVGLGMYWLSALACALIMFILVQLERFEHMVSRGSESRIIRICTDCILHDIADYRKVLARHRINLHNFFVDYDYERQETRLNLVVLLRDSTDYIALFGEFEKLHPTKSITLANQLSI